MNNEMNKNIWRKILWRWYCWITAWCEIIEGVLGVITLGFFRPALSYRWVFWGTINIWCKLKERDK